MTDIIEHAFRENRQLRNWDELAAWLKVHARDVNGAKHLVAASRLAQTDGRLFPDSPEEARLILRKYERQIDPRLH